MVLTFNGFELDPERFELRRRGELVKMEPRVLDVLLYLASHRDRVVSKDELIAEVWRVKFVSDSALARCIHEARRALDDDAQSEKVIKTIYGRGYRFVGDVDETPATMGVPTSEIAREGASRSEPEAPAIEAEGGDVDGSGTAGAVAAGGLSGPRGHRTLIVAVGATTAALTVVWLSAMWSAKRSPFTNAATPAVSALRQLTSGIQDAIKPAFSPDGATLLYVAQEPGIPGVLDVYLMPSTGGPPSRLTAGVAASGDLPVFTADGSTVVFSRFRSGEDGSSLPDLWSVSRFGGEPRLFLEQASGAGFSPDGEWVAYTKHVSARTPLWISRIREMSDHRELAASGFTPRWSPDGSWIAYTTSNPQGGRGVISIIAPATLARRQLTADPQQHYGLAWARDSGSLVFAADVDSLFHLFQVAVSDGYTVPLTAGMGEYSSPTMAPDGMSLVFCHSRPEYTLVIVDGLARAAKMEVSQPEHFLWPRLSPTRSSIASVIRRPDVGAAVYLTDIEERRQTRLTDHTARYPCWISDDELAYLTPAEDGATTEVRVVNTRSLMRFSWTRFQGEARWVAVDPERTRIAAVLRSASGAQRIVVRNLRDLREVVVASGSEYECLRWLPDGRALSWSGPRDSADRGSNGVWTSSVDAPRPVQLSRDGYGPCWSRDGGTVYFSRMGEYSGLWALEVATGTLKLMRQWDEVTAFDVVGERLFYIRSIGRSQLYSMPLDQ